MNDFPFLTHNHFLPVISYILPWLRSSLYLKTGNLSLLQWILKTKKHCPELVEFVDVKQTHIVKMPGKGLSE